MTPIERLAQDDGKARNGKQVTDYTKAIPRPEQPQVPNKTPMHSRTQPATYTLKGK